MPQNLDNLKSNCEEFINKMYNKGYNEITVRLYVCVHRQKVYMSKYLVTAVEMETNKLRSLTLGTNNLIKYTIARWIYEHRREESIEWNTLIFESDGYNVEDRVKFDQKILDRAQVDAQDGVMQKGVRAFFNLINRGVSMIKGSSKAKESQSNSDTYKAFATKKKLESNFDWLNNE